MTSPRKASRRRIGAELRRFIVADVLDGRPGPDDPFAAGRIDSLALEQLATFAAERFGVELSDEDLAAERIGSIDAFADLIHAKSSDPGR